MGKEFCPKNGQKRPFLPPFLHPVFACFSLKKSKWEFMAINGEEIGITSERMGITSEEIVITGEEITLNFGRNTL